MSTATSETPAPTRVSTIELFFDLVFVFTITQVASIIVASPDGSGVGRAALTLSIIYWMYGGYAWLTNSNRPDTAARRAVLLAAMAAFFVCSLAVPTAFGDSGPAFGLAYLAVVLVHAAGFVIYAGPAAIRPVARLLSWNLVSVALIIGAGWAHGAADWVLWAAAVAVQLATPVLIRVGRSFRINAAHFGERHGLVILIVLGESLISVGLASEHEHVDIGLVVGVLAGLLAAAVMWWMYFAADDDLAAAALATAPPDRRPIWAINGYFVAHLLMIFGILSVAAGSRLSVHDLLAPATLASAWLIACGAALYAIGSAAFRQALHFASPWPRVLGGLACLVVVPVGRYGSCAAELAAVAIILGAILVAEARLTAHPDVTASEPSTKTTARAEQRTTSGAA